MKKFSMVIYSILLSVLLSGCTAIGDKTASMSIIYVGTAVFSLLVLLGYCYFIQQKDLWFLLLFSSVFVVNLGYLCLAISQTLEEALLANRISYLGSVFLPITMFMIILRVTNITYCKWIPGLLLSVGIIVFLIAASPGYSDVYYLDVTLESVNGVSTLNKTYGPLHKVYLYYLITSFLLMIGVSVYAVVKDKMKSTIQSVFLILAVFVNLGVWFFEQLVKIDFEILSVSYIISELFLLGLHTVMLEYKDQQKPTIPPEVLSDPIEIVAEAEAQVSPDNSELIAEYSEQYHSGVKDLTPTEKTIFHLYIDGKSTKEIMLELNITENTLKFHNKNIYGKFGVSSRKQLIELHRKIKQYEKDTAS